MEKVLPKEVYLVTRRADTERPLQEKYWNTDEKVSIIALLGQ
jgi:peptide methionine sulfoxide reductase MsrB